MSIGSSIPPPDLGIDSLIDYLLVIRRDFDRLLMYIGHPHVVAMDGFMSGFHACMGVQGVRDERYVRFREWLRTTGELPLEGWYVKYLHDCGGDHLRAIRKLLDLAAEFHALEQRGTC